MTAIMHKLNTFKIARLITYSYLGCLVHCYLGPKVTMKGNDKTWGRFGLNHKERVSQFNHAVKPSCYLDIKVTARLDGTPYKERKR